MIYIGNGIYSTSGSNDYLIHYGVLGMRWGIRKASQYEMDITRGKRAKNRKDYKSGLINKTTYKKNKKRYAKEYSDAMENVMQNARKYKKTDKNKEFIYEKSKRRASEVYDDYDKKISRRDFLNSVSKSLAGASLAASGSSIGSRKISKKLSRGLGVAGVGLAGAGLAASVGNEIADRRMYKKYKGKY